MSDAGLGAGDTLAQIHLQAQAEALRLFGEGPPPPWQPRFPARALIAGTLLVSAGVAAAAWMVAVAEVPAATPAAERPQTPAPGAIEAADHIVDAEPDAPATPRAQAPPVRPSLDAATLVVAHAAAGWRIEANGASRFEAAQQLARLSGSPLLGAVELIARTRPLDMRWQGRDLARAWQEVLGSELNYALQCRRDRCRAWIVAAAAPGPVPALPPSAPTMAALPQEAQARNDTGDVPDRISHD